jgi:hypothetical protein
MVYAVHDIPGTVLGGSTTDLPVGVVINSGCAPAFNGFNFGQIAGSLPLTAPGTYTAEVKPANAIVSCSEAKLLSETVPVTPGLNASIVAHLTDLGTPQILVFVNDISSTQPGQGRFVLHHAAQTQKQLTSNLQSVPFLIRSRLSPRRSQLWANLVEVAPNCITDFLASHDGETQLRRAETG